MNKQQLVTLNQWFDTYVQGFYDMEPDDLRNISLKVEHTRKVCEVIELLSAGEGLNAEETCLASAIALLHDVGRFPQYRRWRTFRDSESDNHARLSLEVIRNQELLCHLPESERMTIEEAVRFHNLLQLPAKLSSPTPLFARLIRDADKLDIWRVFMDFFHTPLNERASAVTLGLPDLPSVSPECVASLAAGKVVHLDTVNLVNDFVLLQISWVYDLNFRSSCRLLQQRGYIQELAGTLPESADVQKAIATAINTINERC